MDKLKGGDENGEDEDTTMTAPESPAKIDFDMSQYQVWAFRGWFAGLVD